MDKYICNPSICHGSNEKVIRASRIFPIRYELTPGWLKTHTGNFLSVDECNDIINWANKQELGMGTTVGDDLEESQSDYRIVETCTLPDDTYSWLYDRLSDEIQNINDMNYQFDISGILEPIILLKYRKYDDGRTGKYDWHADTSGEALRMRKLTCIIQLSDQSEYRGCELQFPSGEEVPETIDKKRPGDLITFPSYERHRVTPLTSGERYALVCWISGPPFR